MKTILITGVNGYLGSKLAEKYSLYNNIVGLEKSTQNLFRLKDKKLKIYDYKSGLDDLFDNHKIDFIIHTATIYGRNGETYSDMINSNVNFPQILLKKAIDYNCKYFINTDTVLPRFTSAYSLTKNHFKDWLNFFSKNYNLKVVNLSVEHFYGPGSSETNFITLMIRKMLKNVQNIPLTMGEQNRDFLYIDDLLSVYDLVIDNLTEFSNFENFNVGSGVNTNLRYILEFIKDYTKSNSSLDFGALKYREDELMNSKNDINKLIALKWKPSIDIQTGLKNVIEYEKNL
ncbi:MAG: epimerase [Legionellales bacterium]|nr:epimerase [Legionellales bacterium]